MLRELFPTPNGRLDPPDERCDIPTNGVSKPVVRLTAVRIVIITGFQLVAVVL